MIFDGASQIDARLGRRGRHARQQSPGPDATQSFTRRAALIAARLVGAAAAVLRVVDVEPQLVLLRGLPRQAHGVDLLGVRVADRTLSSRTQVHAFGSPGVLVAVLVLHFLMRADQPGVAVEPEAVAKNRSAQREAGVPVLDERRLIAESQRPQVVVDVARLPPVAGEAGEPVPAERVAAGLRDDVERRAAAIRLRRGRPRWRPAPRPSSTCRTCSRTRRRRCWARRRSCRRSGSVPSLLRPPRAEKKLVVGCAPPPKPVA